MKSLKFKALIYCLLFAVLSCKNDLKEEVSKEIINENLNIILTPDLSNRVKTGLYPKPVSDLDLIGSILNSYYPTLYEYNHRISGQKDVINLAFTNANIIKEYNYKGEYIIDISNKEEENELYLKTFDGTETQFKKESITFLESIGELYQKTGVKPAGADISSFFKNKLNNIVRKDEFAIIDKYNITTKFRNILVLFTDGYVEAGLYGKSNCLDNKCYFLDGVRIDKFRNDYKKNGKGKDLEIFFRENDYGILPVENDNLKNVEVFVCELYDRSLNKRTGSQTIVPNDLDIIKVFWKDWLTKSGFKKFKLVEKVNSIGEFETEFSMFLNEK
jgi:hypothetical protein